MFAQCNSINKSNYHLINPCRFDIGELVPQFAVHHWKEHEILHNIAKFGKTNFAQTLAEL
jgi:hypothetical protein